MSVREIGWGIFLAGLPFAHFFLWPEQLNQWHAQTLWAQGCLALLFGLSITQSGRRGIRNRPLGCWVAWVSLSVIGIWLHYLRHEQQHPIGILPPFLHCLCLVLFYSAATTQWTQALLVRLLRWIAYTGVVIVIYGILQSVNLDQFYRFIDGTKQTDSIIGTIGNPTHFGTHLALLVPIFLWQPHWWWKVVAGMAMLLIYLTHSSSALLCGVVVLCWWGFQEARLVGWILMGAGILGGLWMLWSRSEWLNSSGRWEMWNFLWQHYMVGDGQQQITGAGLGRIMEDSLRNLAGWPDKWRHAHCAFLQVLIEQGVIGLGIVLWGIGDAIRHWWRLPRTSVSRTLAGIGIAFLLSALVNFPDHLWALASLGLVAYCGIYVLFEESQHGYSNA